jgi:hypothetical protein
MTIEAVEDCANVAVRTEPSSPGRTQACELRVALDFSGIFRQMVSTR